MTAEAAPTARTGAQSGGSPRAGWLEVALLGLLAYVPFFLSSPGKVSADTKALLTLDPGRLLERAPFLWDTHAGLGTVTHQHLGYLVPMGPFFWLFDALGTPAWVTQRLWLGTLSLVAVLGARWLLRLLGASRAGALAGALVYMLTPYQLAFTARSSILLLPWAGLPVLVALTIRADRRGGWRDPAMFALVAFVIAGVNATSLVFVFLGPMLWLALQMVGGWESVKASLLTGARLLVPTVAVSLWWAVGLRTQGTFGLPVLGLTETLRTSSASSVPSDLLRGLGNWFFYGGDRLGSSLDQSADYANTKWVIALSFAIPIAALAVAALVRWRYRAYFALLIVVGTVVGVGAWPFDDPSPYGRLFKALAGESSLVLALRNTPRAVPLIVLGMAGLLAAGVSALVVRRQQLVAAGVVVALAVLALAPVWRHGFLSERNLRDEAVPAYWRDAAAALDAAGDATRVLEIPGSNFAAYRWGNPVDALTPALIDRPWAAREVLPYGTPPSVNLLDALDHRIQEGTLDPDALARVARILAVGTVVLRSDLEYERFDTPRPRLLWSALTDPLGAGLSDPESFGRRTPNRASPLLPMLDELELRTPPDAPDPPPVALFDVEDPVDIVHTAPVEQPVVLSGDGEGIVDAAEAGLLDGNQLVLELATLARAELRAALNRAADLVLTDSNRRRAETFFASVRDTTGETERAGVRRDDDDRDQRLAPFDATDAERTVAEQRGATVDASGYGDTRERYTPEDRPVHAVDGDLRTAWRVGGGADPAGQWLVIEPSTAVRADHITLVQPQTGERSRWLTSVRVRLNDREPFTVELGPESLTPEGQVVRFPERSVERLELEPLATNADPDADPAGANPVGFAEVRLADVRATETIRLPVDLARRVGDAAAGHRLDVVLTRLRVEPGDRERQDVELSLARRFVLPDDRDFGLAGTARVNPNAPDAVLDAVLGTTAPGAVFGASGHLAGDLDARASRAFDHDPTTAWTAPFGTQEGQHLDVSLDAPVTIDHVDLNIVADGRHSVPTRLRLEVDGVPAATLDVPPLADGLPGSAQPVSLAVAPVTGRAIRLVVEATRPVVTVDDRSRAGVALPVAIADATIAGVPAPAIADEIATTCRDDLVSVDRRPVAVRIVGSATDARRGLAVVACTPGVALDAGSHAVRSATGLDTGIDVDQVVLSSDAEAVPASVIPLGAPLTSSGARVDVLDHGASSYDLRVHTDGAPFWLVLGESHSDAWSAEIVGGPSLGEPRLVDGYANGWVVRPGGPGVLEIRVRWTAQDAVWIGMAVSALAVIVCLGIVVVTRRRGFVPIAAVPSLVSPLRYPDPAPSVGITAMAAIAIALGAAAVSRWWVGVVVGVAAILATRATLGRIVLVAGAPLALAVSKLAGAPEVGWLAVTLLAADLVVGWVRHRWGSAVKGPG